MRDVSVTRPRPRYWHRNYRAEWKPLVEQAKGNTATRVTERGVEYMAICSQRQVSDDQAAEMVFRQEDLDKAKDKNAPPENPNATKISRRAAQEGADRSPLSSMAIAFSRPLALNQGDPAGIGPDITLLA